MTSKSKAEIQSKQGSWLRLLRWGDLALIFSLVFFSIIVVPLLHTIQARAGKAEKALVFVDNKLVAQLDLREDRQITVSGPLGKTGIEVKDGRVRVVRSPGFRQLCVKRGWIAQPGDILICLPNRVIVEIPGQHRDYDALVY